MKLARIERGEGFGWAAIFDEAAFDLSDLIGTGPGAIHSWLDREGRLRLEEQAHRQPPLPREALRFAPCLPDPEKIICVGVNYHNRNEEYRDGSQAPAYPSLFLRNPGSFTAHGQPLVRPRESEQLDYEGEIAIVIGKSGRRIKRAEAEAHIAALTLVNEGTLRDWVRHAKFNVTQGKNFDRSGSIGPWMVTAEEFEAYGDLELQTRVNGEIRQQDTTANMIFPFDALIEYISSFTTLKPGDVISTGTPTGAGARFDPPIYLKPGDEVEVFAPRIGTLRNGVVDG
jgi:2-keto-4-pentenoate hydratase/2-oxohepta-3-ene-1,7-dioic acid hydratase in catechol pathway